MLKASRFPTLAKRPASERMRNGFRKRRAAGTRSGCPVTSAESLSLSISSWFKIHGAAAALAWLIISVASLRLHACAMRNAATAGARAPTRLTLIGVPLLLPRNGCIRREQSQIATFYLRLVCKILSLRYEVKSLCITAGFRRHAVRVSRNCAHVPSARPKGSPGNSSQFSSASRPQRAREGERAPSS